MTVDAVYTTKREEVEQRVVRDVQRLLDTYGIGVHMVGINLLSVHAPEEVHAAFRDVASAHEDKVLIVNRASTFAQEAVNLAEGDAAAMIASAWAFKDEKVLQAEGDALAFTLREKEYRRAPDLTRFRLHLEALEETLPRRREDRAAGPRGREGLRPVAAPPVRREEGSVKALPRTLTLVGAVVTALAVWSCFVVSTSPSMASSCGSAAWSVWSGSPGSISRGRTRSKPWSGWTGASSASGP